MYIRPALIAVSLAFSMTLGCSGDEATVSTGDTTPSTDITSTTPAPATDVTTSEPATTTTTSPAPSSTTTQTATTQTATTQTATTQTATTTTSLPRPTASSEPVTVLAVDVDGVWLWTDEDRRLVIDGSVGSAIPDRVGGIVYQNVETGEWRADQYGAPPNTAQWKWVGVGSAEPIRRVLSPGGAGGIVVEPPPDGIVRIVDTAIVDGHPTLAYLRTRHFTITIVDENPWWDSRAAELVVHDLTTGVERVIRTRVDRVGVRRSNSLTRRARGRRSGPRLWRGQLDRAARLRRHVDRGHRRAVRLRVLVRPRGRPRPDRRTAGVHPAATVRLGTDRW